MIQITCNGQPILVALSSIVRGSLYEPGSPVIVDPDYGAVCGQYEAPCETCVLFGSSTCLQYSIMLRHLTTNFPDQFQDYPELLL